MSEETILGTTKISDRWRVSLLKDVRKTLRDVGENPEIGDIVVFKRRGDDIIVELG